MAEKLKSILKQTHWSLVLKAASFALAWFVLPFWLFLLIALYLYFVPPGGAKLTLPPYIVLILISAFEGQNIFFAVVIGAVFYYLLLIKDLLIIDRKSAYEVLILIISVLLFREFYLKQGGSFADTSLLYSVLVAWIFGWLVSSFIKNFSPDLSSDGEERSMRRIVSWISFLLMWQFLLLGLVLPLDFIYQSAIVFLAAVAIVDLLPQHLFGELTRAKVFAASSVIFSTLVIILTSARWGL